MSVAVDTMTIKDLGRWQSLVRVICDLVSLHYAYENTLKIEKGDTQYAHSEVKQVSPMWRLYVF